MYIKPATITITILLSFSLASFAQVKQESGDSLVVTNNRIRVVVNNKTGKVSYRFAGGIYFDNTIAYVEDLQAGYLSTADFKQHDYFIAKITDSLFGKGIRIDLVHRDNNKPLRLIQHITLYEKQYFLLLNAEAKNIQTGLVQARNISPITLLPAQGGKCVVPGNESRFVDFPFDNDNWVDVLSRKWPAEQNKNVAGISFELASVHDEITRSGFVIGSVQHDFWKTGIRYATGKTSGQVDSLIVYGGAAIKDDPSLPVSLGGYDGTHDFIRHGTMQGKIVRSPLIYLSAGKDVRKVLVEFGQINARTAGRLLWNGYAPVYWNSFGVEDVLGYRKVMMPEGVLEISDYIHLLKHFNQYAKPVLSIDSYDQDIYSTDVLKSISLYGKKKNQQMGFYFIPFAIWTWKNSVEQTKLTGTDYSLKDVVLRDNNNNPIPYKNGDWAAYPIDPSHPATKAYIVSQLQKAKAVHAKFLKIDFLSAGSLESATRNNPAIRSGMQAYNEGMKMLKALVDSILGPDIFITMAISPMFPHQYAHTRFVSTDVYSHLRNDQPGFPRYGSISSSMISASHLWWVQGTLWSYTNMDAAIMKSFQKNSDLSEQEIKVKIYSMITLGSILGDGSDLRNKTAMQRAKKFLDNAAVCSFFSRPKAFTPLRFSNGQSQGQQLSFYLPADTVLISVFNFDTEKEFTETFFCKDLGLINRSYLIKDFSTDKIIGRVEKNQTFFSLNVAVKDALLVKLVPDNK